MISNISLLSLQNSTTETNVSNPCYPRGYITTFPMGHLFDSLCTEDLRPGGYAPDDIITFEGSGDPLLCRVKVASLFAFKACHDQEVCCFDGVYQPKVKGPFVVRAETTEIPFFPTECLLLGFLSLPPCLPLSHSPSRDLGHPSHPEHHVRFCLLPGLCGILLHSQCSKPLGQLFPERFQLEHLGLLLPALESGECLKRRDQ